ncbi:hypothetical protein BVY04_04060 [bacterium M21]|nr:hypothetical protein BVY04_04060 [bacterium M21]
MIKFRQLLWLLYICLSCCLTTQAADADVTMRLDDMKEEIPNLQNRLAGDMQIHGFISQGWIYSSDNDWMGNTDGGSFDFHEIGLNFMTNLSDDFHLGLQLMSREIGHYKTDQLTVDWAYGDYHLNKLIGIRMGRVQTPVGMHNETRDIDALRVPIFLPQSTYSETTRDVATAINGAVLYGTIPGGIAGSIDYLTWVGGLTLKPDEGLGRRFEDSGLFDVHEVNLDYSIGGVIFWNTPLHGLRLNGVYDIGRGVEIVQTTTAALVPLGIPVGSPATTTMDQVAISGIGFDYDLGQLNLSGEYRYTRSDMRTVIANGAIVQDEPMDIEGYYLMSAYELTHKLAVAVTYSVQYPDTNDRDGSEEAEDWYAWQKDFTLSARYNVNPNWTLKAEVHFVNGVGQLLDSDHPNGYDENWQGYLLKTSYSF